MSWGSGASDRAASLGSDRLPLRSSIIRQVDDRFRFRRVAAGLVCLLGLAMFATGTAAAAAAEWRTVPAPLPAGASSASFNAVACAWTRSCWAVGMVSAHHRGDRALAEHWNGRTWRVVTVPSPKAFGQTDLTGVACDGNSACIAVGQRGAGQGGTLVERWDGARWSVQAAPSPGGSSLSDVSCVSAVDCLAVGNSGSFDSTGIFNYSLNLHWNGTSWAAEPDNVTGWLTGVSCTSSVFCSAVGFLADSAGYQSSAEQWNGTSVSDVPSGDNNSSEPQAVSCASSKFCMAVGTDEGDFVSRWNGHRWKFYGSPGGLDTVWCLRSDLCLAAGSTAGKHGYSFARVERRNGTRWSVQLAGPVAGTEVNGVTCASPSACVAVGASGSRPLVLRYR